MKREVQEEEACQEKWLEYYTGIRACSVPCTILKIVSLEVPASPYHSIVW